MLTFYFYCTNFVFLEFVLDIMNDFKEEELMEAIRKITTISNGVIYFDELNKYNQQKVEVIVLPLINHHIKKSSSKKEKLLQFDGILKSNTKDTSVNVDELIYGK